MERTAIVLTALHTLRTVFQAAEAHATSGRSAWRLSWILCPSEVRLKATVTISLCVRGQITVTARNQAGSLPVSISDRHLTPFHSKWETT